jgi:hypothetical protein
MAIDETTSRVSAEEVRAFATSPAQFFDGSWYAMQHVEPERLAALQLTAVQYRFKHHRDQIATLRTMSDELGISEIATLDDVIPLLFQHSVYKSYPASLLEHNRFGHLTRWLDRLTTYDLSQLDVDRCDSIDSWLEMLDSRTELRVAHSSGTAGKMSFLPRSLDDWDRMWESARPGMFQFSDPLGEYDHDGEYFNLVWPLYRYGRSAITRLPETAMTRVMGSEDRLHVLRQGRMSSDAMYLAGRLRLAAARGELDRLEINPALRARREEFEREQRELSEALPRFIEQTIERLKGQRVWMLATWNVYYEMARAGLDHGLEGVFAPDSLISAGGGAKGQVVPDDWEDLVKRFIGVERLQHAYAMTELTGMNKLCEHGHYHFEPWIVPFVLDPDDGTSLPRAGVQTGRMACFDVLPNGYWGGFITGDEVTAHWSPCPCGRATPHIERRIERYSDKRGDDKITCAAADEAHRAALEFLTERLA